MSGLSLEVPGWTDAELAVNVPPHGSNTWQANTDFPSGKASCVEVMDAIVAWGNDAARPWSGSATFSWTLTDPPVGPHDAFLGFLIASGVSGTGWTPNAGFTAQCGIPAATANRTQSSASSAPKGTVSARFNVAGGRRKVQEPGGRSPAGAYMRNPGHASPVPLRLDTVLAEPDVYALTRAIELASSPTRGHVYRHSTEEWLELAAVGQIPAPSHGVELYRVSFAAWEAR